MATDFLIVKSIQPINMKKILIIISIFLFPQCEGMLEGYWSTQFQNLSDHKIIFYIDVVEDDGFYARESYYDPSDNFLKYAQEFQAKMKNPEEYSLPYLPVHLGEIVSVYAIHPDTLEKYSWEEIKISQKYWFERIYFPRESKGDIGFLFPLELNRVVKD